MPNARAPAGASATGEEEVRVFARRASSRRGEDGTLGVRPAKKAALDRLSKFAAASRLASSVLALRKYELESVRAARRSATSGIKWFCTPSRLACTDDDVDAELGSGEAECAEEDDEREAAQFESEEDDGDDYNYGGSAVRASSGIDELPLGEEVEVARDGFEYLCSESLASWLEARVGNDSAEIVGERLVNMFVPADRVLYWDGEDDGSELPAGLRKQEMTEGCFYASNLEENREGRPPVWWPILLYTLEREGPNTTSPGHSQQESNVAMVEDPAGTHVMLYSEKMHVVLDFIYEQCMQRPNRPYRTDGAWSRPASLRIKEHFDKRSLTFAQSKERECAKCSVVNAARVLCPESDDFVMKIALETPAAAVRCLRDLGKWVSAEIGVLEVQRATSKKGKYSEDVSVDWVLKNTSDVLLVNVIGSGSVNHIICVDARQGHRRIYDSFERHPIRLSAEALRCCVGDGREVQHVYARKVVIKHNCEDIISGKRELKKTPNGRKRKRRAMDN